MKKNEEKINKFITYSLSGAIICMFGLILITNLFHFGYKMNSDIASEAILARLIWQRKEWVPETWFPSTELRILGTPNLAALVYGVTRDMTLAMGIACTLMTAGILASAFFLISQFSFKMPEKLMFLLLCLVTSNHFTILELFYVFAGYYAIHIIVMFFTMGIYVRLIAGRHIHKIWLMIMLLPAFVMGMQGVRGILIVNGPLVITEIARQLYYIYRRKWKWQDVIPAVWCMGLFFVGYVGTGIPMSVGQENVSRNIRHGLQKLWETVIPDVVACVGWMESGIAGKVLLLIMLIIAFAFLALCVKDLILHNDCVETWMNLFIWVSPVISVLLAAFTTAQSSERYYFMFIFAIIFGVVNIMGRIPSRFRKIKGGGYGIVVFLLIMQIKNVYLPVLRSPEPIETEMYETGRYLEEKEYHIAYADFETAASITVLIDGNIVVAPVASLKTMEMCKWLSSTHWYVPNVPFEASTAYIVTETEKGDFEEFYRQHQGKLQFDRQIGKFLIYISDYNFSCLE